VCDLHHTRVRDEKHRFFGLASKSVAMVISGLASKPLLRILGLGIKTKVNALLICTSKLQRYFLGVCLKIKWEKVCQFAYQNR
jgi:hypothetical protein